MSDTNGTFHAKMGTIKDLTEAEDITRSTPVASIGFSVSDRFASCMFCVISITGTPCYRTLISTEPQSATAEPVILRLVGFSPKNSIAVRVTVTRQPPFNTGYSTCEDIP